LSTALILETLVDQIIYHQEKGEEEIQQVTQASSYESFDLESLLSGLKHNFHHQQIKKSLTQKHSDNQES